MRAVFAALALGLLIGAPIAAAQGRSSSAQIDYSGFRDLTGQVEALRAQRLVSLADFQRMAGEPNTIVLDARSADAYAQGHIAGAVNLSFPDFTQQSLAQAIGGLETTVLIYCNNNFRNEPEAFPTKRIDVALNLSTYESLYAYGYRNVYELAPLLDPATANLPFAGSLASPEMAAR